VKGQHDWSLTTALLGSVAESHLCAALLEAMQVPRCKIRFKSIWLMSKNEMGVIAEAMDIMLNDAEAECTFAYAMLSAQRPMSLAMGASLRRKQADAASH